MDVRERSRWVHRRGGIQSRSSRGKKFEEKRSKIKARLKDKRVLVETEEGIVELHPLNTDVQLPVTFGAEDWIQLKQKNSELEFTKEQKEGLEDEFIDSISKDFKQIEALKSMKVDNLLGFNIGDMEKQFEDHSQMLQKKYKIKPA